MIIGMSFSAFTTLHVVISLVAMAAGFVVMYGMVAGRRLPGWTATFLATIVLTSVTGFMLPLNVVVGLVQAFGKISFLHQLAPTQTEAPFLLRQILILLLFAAAGCLALRRFHPEPPVLVQTGA